MERLLRPLAAEVWVNDVDLRELQRESSLPASAEARKECDCRRTVYFVLDVFNI